MRTRSIQRRGARDDDGLCCWSGLVVWVGCREGGALLLGNVYIADDVHALGSQAGSGEEGGQQASSPSSCG